MSIRVSIRVYEKVKLSKNQQAQNSKSSQSEWFANLELVVDSKQIDSMLILCQKYDDIAREITTFICRRWTWEARRGIVVQSSGFAKNMYGLNVSTEGMIKYIKANLAAKKKESRDYTNAILTRWAVNHQKKVKRDSHLPILVATSS